MIWKIFVNLLFTGMYALVNSVEVHFETSDSGFFLKHSPRQSGNTAAADITSNPARTKVDQESILSVDRFTTVQSTQPVSIRASYGPFSTKQTVPARFIVPDTIESQNDHTQQNATVALMELQQANVHLDISAHLVKSTIPRDSPVLRVLFHAGADPGGHLQRQKICVLLHASMAGRTPLKGRCMPEGEDGVCVAEVIIPSAWWPPLPPPDKDGRSVSQKVPQRNVQVSYSVFEPARNPEQCEPKVQIQPLTPFAQVPLVAALTAYKELRADDTLTILIPHQPLFPMSRIHVPVFLQPQVGQNVAVFIVRARVKAGMRILGASASSDLWNISVEKENPKHTVARVTAFRKDQDPDSPTRSDETVDATQVVEVFSWLLEVANDTKEHWDGGKIVWSVSYVHDGPKMKDLSIESANGPEETRKKLVAKLEIQKDDIQAVLPISKNWEVMNTAVLTGRQVSQALKVFIVSQGGKVADVTLQSSCHAEDESVIKVSSSCSSVYVDGSEARGSSNASIIVKYGTYSGLARFIVWMPEFPLEVSVTDFRLSQIKGWKIPDDMHSFNAKSNRRKRAYGWNRHVDDFVNGVSMERTTCRARYQQSPVEVYARFLAIDQDSGRVSYLISRRTGLRVTDLVQPLLRVADPKIATLRGRILQGRAMGRTDVQVLSPITGRVIGAKEIRVGSDRVSITRLLVRVVSGLQLNITPDSAIENGYVAETSVTRKLTAQYQEGLLDIDLEFSDGARTPLRDVSVDDYFLLVESLDTEVVAFAPMLASHHPRVIAVGEGSGNLLRVNLLLSEECRLRRNIPLLKQVREHGSKSPPGPLASALAAVQVDFNSNDSSGRSDTVQNDGISGRERKISRDSSDLADILIGIPKDDSIHEPSIQARQHRGGMSSIGRHNFPHDMSSMEIGMYVLLTVFCFAILVFVVACVVYASKFRPISMDNDIKNRNKDRTNSLRILRGPKKISESTTNAHDWVWLGRSTMDRSSMVQDGNGNAHIVNNQRDSRIRITSNPMNLNYADPDDTLVEVTCFDNPNHIRLPATNNNNSIDTSTYNKRDKNKNGIEKDIPPPLPPHGVLSTNDNNSQKEYRPPVPPHRNVGVSTAPKIPEIIFPPKRYHHHNKHHRNSGHYQNKKTNGNAKDDLASKSDEQDHTNHNFNGNESQSLDSCRNEAFDQQMSNVAHVEAMAEELHMAEKLVENAALQQKTAFQFDTLTPKTKHSDEDEPTRDDFVVEKKWKPHLREARSLSGSSLQKNKAKSEYSLSDDGGFVTSSEDLKLSKKVKRATVVGNQMFSRDSNSDMGPTESLGLDDLDMDYEQIMHYFDNLKESNA
ncbi:transmembrane protein 132E isoform X1 [Bradysia coprophila]|uniref:transmembrane protein 132E isoform X1 n=1 Tax=Bradysia coprophila TaxID=38358 RepID=UPI00187D920F|nr:transmembrane protein 132E isoform X1 [Bradysia coprophila]